ncbi:unnamed protein product [Vitrella brassicaformis CCMP3155]|uniref:Uncharacterized protein n=1 Tax=Vitrella brassicaformis (strain CCMP3155) TaxID=1169540 RepID=A0A0G4EN12_VITBC|nr:unnamed protein product [Vitrella brassicaformis CCMP3155]|eukprot:CEL98380.1 unnamed protein product [Vitrella brassicaformis CCMP3155]
MLVDSNVVRRHYSSSSSWMGRDAAGGGIECPFYLSALQGVYGPSVGLHPNLSLPFNMTLKDGDPIVLWYCNELLSFYNTTSNQTQTLPMKPQQFCAPTMDGKSRCTCQVFPWERTDNRTDMPVCLPLPKELKEKWVSDTSFVQHTRG